MTDNRDKTCADCCGRGYKWEVIHKVLCPTCKGNGKIPSWTGYTNWTGGDD
jgi:DnaJ-class molecular chaperone